MNPTTRKPYTVIALRHGGTHLINPTVRFLTGKTVYSPKGENALTCVPGPIVIVFLRDPRNWLVSSYKWKHGRNAAEKNDAALAEFMTARRKGMSPIAFVKAWAARWVCWPGALTVRFEDLLPPKGESETARIAAFLNAPRDPVEVHGEVYGKSGTYTGQPSDWREWFGKRTAKAWETNGGAELLARMGYE